MTLKISLFSLVRSALALTRQPHLRSGWGPVREQMVYSLKFWSDSGGGLDCDCAMCRVLSQNILPDQGLVHLVL